MRPNPKSIPDRNLYHYTPHKQLNCSLYKLSARRYQSFVARKWLFQIVRIAEISVREMRDGWGVGKLSK